MIEYLFIQTHLTLHKLFTFEFPTIFKKKDFPFTLLISIFCQSNKKGIKKPLFVKHGLQMTNNKLYLCALKS